METIVTLSPWSFDAYAYIRTCTGVNATERFRDEIARGIAQLWRCEYGEYLGFIVSRLERVDFGIEWVLLAGAGLPCVKALPMFLTAARDAGITVRCHVERTDLIGMYERLGFKYCETVMRADHGKHIEY